MSMQLSSERRFLYCCNEPMTSCVFWNVGLNLSSNNNSVIIFSFRFSSLDEASFTRILLGCDESVAISKISRRLPAVTTFGLSLKYSASFWSLVASITFSSALVVLRSFSTDDATNASLNPLSLFSSNGALVRPSFV